MTSIRQRLRTAPYEVVGRFADASNATLLARLTDRDDTPLPAGVVLDDLDPADLAVYKPQRGEAPLWDFPDGTLHRREVAAAVVSDALGWDLVPDTVLRDDGPFGAGSLQRYVPHDPQVHFFSLRDDPDPHIAHQLRAMVVFDLVVGNADRKGGHVLLEVVDDVAHVRCIDHGVCFSADHKLRTVAWDFAHEPVPADLHADVAGLATWLAGDGEQVLAGLLDPAEVAALAVRIDQVAALDVLPPPIGDRPYPWPLL